MEQWIDVLLVFCMQFSQCKRKKREAFVMFKSRIINEITTQRTEEWTLKLYKSSSSSSSFCSFEWMSCYSCFVYVYKEEFWARKEVTFPIIYNNFIIIFIKVSLLFHSYLVALFTTQTTLINDLIWREEISWKSSRYCIMMTQIKPIRNFFQWRHSCPI